MDKRGRSKSISRSRSKKRIKRETEGRFYHSAHGSLSTKKEYINENEVSSTFGYPETHFVNGEKKAGQVYPIKVGKDVSGVNATIYFKINSDMCTSTRTGDNSKAETEGKLLDNLDKFHTLFTIEAEGKGTELIIKKVLVHSPSTASLRIGSQIIDEMTPEQHVDHIIIRNPDLKYMSASQPPEIFYDGKTMTRNIPNLEFFYEANFNTGLCGIGPDNKTKRLTPSGKLWWKTEMMKINKIKDKPGLHTFPMNDKDNSSPSTSSSSSKSTTTTTLQEMFRDVGLIGEYKEIINDYDITTYPKDYDESDTKIQMKIMQEELADYLGEASEIYFHHPNPWKSLLSTTLAKATFHSKPGDNLSVTIYNSTCLVNQKRRVGDHEVFTENPVEDRMRYPDFYRLYEGPMDRSILLNMQELSSKVTEANRQIDSNIESISVRENWIREDKQTIKKHPPLAEFKDGSESINDRIKRYNDVIEKFEKEITEQRTKIKRFEQEINVSKKQQKAQKLVKTLDAQVLQPGTKRKGRLRRKKKKKKGKKKKDSKRRNRYTHRR